MRLRQHRQARGYTQQALAQKAAVTREYVNYLEHGKYDPTLGVLVRLAKALGTTVGGLLSGPNACPSRAPSGRGPAPPASAPAGPPSSPRTR
jgi:transcriptional regulator with XRE-family HTH domain